MKDYLVKFGPDGRPTAAYANNVHYFIDAEGRNITDGRINVNDAINDGAVFISTSNYMKILGNTNNGKRYIRNTDGTLTPEPDPEPPTLDELKETKAQEVRDWASKKMTAVQAGYSEPEISSFSQQKAGAADILAGNTDTDDAKAVISLLTVRLGLADGETPTTEQQTEFAQRIKDNADRAEAALIKIMGTQQRLDDLIKAAQTADDLAAISWPETLR